jgi:hypothetical protein
MCRQNFIVVIFYIFISISAGMYLASLVLRLIEYPDFFITAFISFICVFIVGLFLLPALDKFTV